MPGNRGGTAGPEHGFDSPEAIEAEAMLSGGGAGAEGGIVVPWPLLFRHRMHTKVRTSDRYQWWVLWTVLAGLLSVNITFTVFVVALPQVAHQLHTSVSTLTWTSTGPLLAFGVAAPVLGKLGDIGGYRRLYLWGLLGAAVCVILTATAPNAGVLIGARLLDGVEGAATGAASMALMLQVFSNEDRVKAMGWWALVGAGGPVIGVTVGAPIIQYFGWRALFWGELPLMAMAAVLAFIVLPGPGQLHPGATRAEADPGVPAGPHYSPWRHLDWTGSFTLAASVTAGLLALNLAPAHGFASPLILSIFGISIVAGVWFVVQEQRTDHPLIPLRYFRMRNFTFPLAAKALTNFSYMGGFFLFPLLMEGIYGYSETRAGLVSTARPLLFSLVAPVAGYTAVVIGERISTVVGTLTLAGSMVVFTQIGGHPSLVIILIALALSGAGIGIATPSTTSSSSNEVDLDELGVMSAAQQLVTQVGVVAGIQVMVTVQASAHGGVGSLASFHRAYLVGLAVALAATVCAFFMRNTPRPGRQQAAEGEPGGLTQSSP
ncbi:MAG TPA: MFS transporter [Acidimicrobiales bacterium]|nr:MFS transporter [Acidimicrobiales bacterium]